MGFLCAGGPIIVDLLLCYESSRENVRRAAIFRDDLLGWAMLQYFSVGSICQIPDREAHLPAIASGINLRLQKKPLRPIYPSNRKQVVPARLAIVMFSKIGRNPRGRRRLDSFLTFHEKNAHMIITYGAPAALHHVKRF